MQSVTRRYRRVRAGVWALEHLRGAREQGLPISAQLVARKDVEVAVNLRRVRRLVTAIEDRGGRVVGFEPGRVEFPAAELGPDGFSYFCWQLGEPRILYRRSVGEEFHARQPLQAG